MPGPLSHEPTLQALVADVLPLSSRVLSGKGRLRRRVAWPLLARTTGLGEIDGGEIVLVPAVRGRDVVPRLKELEDIGVVAVLMAADEPAAFWADRLVDGLPLIVVPADTDMRRLQGEIERYITRRRRELFALDRELHHLLVDVSLAGATLVDLLSVAATKARKPVVLDRDGDVQFAPGPANPIAPDVLLQARIATRASDDNVEIPGPPCCLAAPVSAGRGRRGIAILVGADDSLSDDDEAILVSLASACAIALAREPDVRLPNLSDVLAGLRRPAGLEPAPDPGRPQGHGTKVGESWTALAIEDDSSASLQLERALASELGGRRARFLAAREGNVLCALVAAEGTFAWSATVRSLGVRLGSNSLRAGVGRSRPDAGGARQSADEALQAVRHALPGTVLTYAEIELSVLLRTGEGWSDFARSRLSGLTGRGADERELLHTLSAYLQSGRNAKTAARLLQIHRNTLLYRLRRIEQRLDVSLAETETLFELDLATRIVALTESRYPLGLKPAAGTD